ncbi:MAG: Grx4 family monothiol glutaredoxin [Sandaracinaceae bacterium]|nr:Grx4 family monothiol glutaredoxin [Sandaracinaceae bacterium]
MSTQESLRKLVQDNEVVLFMKGTRSAPQCGFSATVIAILDDFLDDYATVNVLADPDVRAGIKEFSSWPTIPQLYVKGEFIGGCDIVKELNASGELAGVLGRRPAEVAPPEVAVTEAAVTALREFHDGPGPLSVRIQISGRFEYGMDFDDEKPGDLVVTGPGLQLLFDRASAKRADGMVIDFVKGPNGEGGFKMDNPNEPAKVRQVPPQVVASWQAEGKSFEFFDVRTPAERETAAIAGTQLLDDAGRALLEKLEKDTVLVFHCHHGMRSQAAAEHCLRLGFTQVYNVAGGIAAWSRDVDPSIPQY